MTEINKVVYGGNTLIDLTNDDVTASDVRSGVYFHDASGVRTQGTLVPNSVTQDQDGYIVLPPNGGGGGGGGGTTELVQTWTYDKLLVEDEGIPIPSYSTSSTTVISATELSPTISIDFDYEYYWIKYGLCYPIYNTSTHYQGKTEFSTYAQVGSLYAVEKNTYSSLDGTAFYNGNIITSHSTSAVRCLHWSSASSIGITQTMYGGVVNFGSPTINTSTGIFTLKTPTISTRGGDSYYNSTAHDETDDIRNQYIVKVYRSPRSDMLIEPNYLMGEICSHIWDCVYNNNLTLT